MIDDSLVTYTLEVEPEDLQVRENLVDSGDPEVDKKMEDEVLEELERGNLWAWGYVKVTAELHGFKGIAGLGGCAYKNEKEFRTDAYFESLKKEALDALVENCEHTIQLAEEAERTLRILKPPKVIAICSTCKKELTVNDIIHGVHHKDKPIETFCYDCVPGGTRW